MGNAYLKWAFSEAVVLFLRETREAQQYVQRLERKYGKAKTRGILAHRLGRTVYYLLKHHQVLLTTGIGDIILQILLSIMAWNLALPQ